jgi:hypothetical protein
MVRSQHNTLGEAAPRRRRSAENAEDLREQVPMIMIMVQDGSDQIQLLNHMRDSHLG